MAAHQKEQNPGPAIDPQLIGYTESGRPFLREALTSADFKAGSDGRAPVDNSVSKMLDRPDISHVTYPDPRRIQD